MPALQAENRVAVNGCVATGFNLWDYEGISVHHPCGNAKQNVHLLSDERPDTIFCSDYKVVPKVKIFVNQVIPNSFRDLMFNVLKS